MMNLLRSSRSSVSPIPPSLRLLFLLGGPGSGKGSLSSLLHRHRSYRHISVGDLCRQEISSGSLLGTVIAPAVRRGAILPSFVSTGLLMRRLRNAETGQVVVDGFPRQVGSARLWEQVGVTPKLVVALEVGDDVMRNRLGKRGRMDDEENVVEARIVKHWKEWDAIKAFYRQRGLLQVVNGEGDLEEVWQRLKQTIDRNETNI